MSRTFEGNSITQAVAEFLKRSAGSVTGWLNRYHADLFFRTEVNVIALLASFAVVVLILVGASYDVLHREISAAVAQGFAGSPGVGLGAAVIAETNRIRVQTLLELIAVVMATTAVFSYVIARVTLSPTRNALASQKQFIGNIAHELRTPLSIIKTNTELALLEHHLNRDMKTTLESNIEELDRVSEIINNLLTLTALVRPERMEFGSVDLSSVATDTIQKFAHLAKRNEVEITLRKSPDTWVWGNGTALQQIVGNLLKNAIQYTQRKGHVRITIEPAPEGQVELIVQDSGIGIARKDLFRIFEPFYRTDPSRTRGQGGSGLGLTIVSELVKMHHGKIAVRSALGRGTTVSVRFPGVLGRGMVGKEVDAKETLSEIAVDFSHRS